MLKTSMGKTGLLRGNFKYLAVFFVLICSTMVKAQTNDSIDLELEELNYTVKKKNDWKLLFGFDSRTSWVLGESAGIGGLKAGVTLNKRHRFGIGIYFLKNPITRGGVNLSAADYPAATDTTQYNFAYSSLFYEPVWYESRRLSLSTPFHYGTATIRASYLRNDTIGNIYTEYFNQQVPLTEVSGVATYKLVRWFAFGVGGGYRALLTPDRNIRRAFSGPVIIFQAKLMLGVLYKLAFKKPIDDGWEQRED